MLRFRLLCVFAFLAACARLAGAQTTGPLAFARTDYAFDSYLISLAVGDFNGDGRNDVLSVSAYGGITTVSVLPGNGDGTFRAATASSSADYVGAGLATSDFNGDGKLDVALADDYNGVLKVLLGNGDGTFQPPVAYPIAQGANSLVAADFNRDGIPDLAAGSTSEQAVTVLLGNGDGTFQPQVLSAQYQVNPYSLAVGDLDGDGNLDVVAGGGDSTVSVLLGGGDGTFYLALSYPVGSSDFGRGAVSVSDLNGDGAPDVVVANQSSGDVSVLLNWGFGQLQPEVRYPMFVQQNLGVGDLDGDGKPDIVGGGNVLIGNGDGTFRSAASVGQAIGRSLRISEFDGDGRADLVTDGDVTVSVLLQRNSASLELSSSDDPLIDGHSVLTAAVTPSSAEGTVTFTARSTVYDAPPVDLGTVAVDGGVATVVASGLTLYDQYSISAVFHSPVYAAAAFMYRNSVPGTGMPTSTTVSSDAVNNTSAPGAAVTFTATVTGFDTASPGSVEFLIDGRSIASGVLLADGVAATSISTLSIGAHTVTAIYTSVGGNDGSSSGSLVHTVAGVPATSTTLTSSANPSASGQPVTFVATVSNLSGGAAPAGSVQFLDGTTVMTTKPLHGGTVSYTAANLIAGSHVVTAQFVGNATLPASTSNAIDQQVLATVSSLAVTPAQVVGTNSAQGTIHLTDPAPGEGLDVEITYFPYGVVTAPSIVAVPAGQTSATFAITTSEVAETIAVTVYASAHGITKHDSLTLKPIALTSFAATPKTVKGGYSVTGTVTINAAAPAEGKVVNLVSDSTSVMVPAAVTIPAGATQATFFMAARPVATDQVVTLTATLNGISKTATLTVTAPTLTAIKVAPASAIGGVAGTGTVTLTSVAPAGGWTVSLASDSAAAVVPPVVIVAAGATSATFPITTSPVAADLTATITAAVATVTKSDSIQIKTPTPSRLVVTPANVIGGNAATGVLTMTGPAPAGGIDVALVSANAAATVPAVVTIPAGQNQITFAIATTEVAANTAGAITATRAGLGTHDTLTVTAPNLLKVAMIAAVVGGTSVTGTVTLKSPAPVGGTSVALTSSHASAAVPATVVVAASMTTATFAVTTLPTPVALSALITATLDGVSRPDTLTIQPIVPKVVRMPLPANVIGGGARTGTVTLTAPAPAGGWTVLLSSDRAAAVVPAEVTVPAGSTDATFPITTSAVPADVTATITAAVGSVAKTGSLLIKAPTLATVGPLSVTPAIVLGGTAATGVVRISGPAPAGGIDVALASTNAAAMVPAVVTIPEGETQISFEMRTNSVAAKSTGAIAATRAGITQRANVTVVPRLIDSVSVTPAQVRGGSTATVRVTLSGPAPHGGSTVFLTGTNILVVWGPSEVVIPEGQSFVEFSVLTSAVPWDTEVVIQADYVNSKSARLIVTP